MLFSILTKSLLENLNKSGRGSIIIQFLLGVEILRVQEGDT